MAQNQFSFAGNPFSVHRSITDHFPNNTSTSTCSTSMNNIGHHAVDLHNNNRSVSTGEKRKLDSLSPSPKFDQPPVKKPCKIWSIAETVNIIPSENNNHVAQTRMSAAQPLFSPQKLSPPGVAQNHPATSPNQLNFPPWSHMAAAAAMFQQQQQRLAANSMLQRFHQQQEQLAAAATFLNFPMMHRPDLQSWLQQRNPLMASSQLNVDASDQQPVSGKIMIIFDSSLFYCTV